MAPKARRLGGWETAGLAWLCMPGLKAKDQLSSSRISGCSFQKASPIISQYRGTGFVLVRVTAIFFPSISAGSLTSFVVTSPTYKEKLKY